MSYINAGNLRLREGTSLLPLPCSTSLYQSCLLSGDFAPLRERLEDHGVLLLRGVLDSRNIRKAASVMTDFLTREYAPWAKDGGSADNRRYDKPFRKGWTVYTESGEVVGDAVDLDREARWKQMLNRDVLPLSYGSPALMEFYKKLFGGPVSALTDCTWMRVRGKREKTAEHMDYYFFKENTDIFKDYVDEDLAQIRKTTDGKRAKVAVRCMLCAEECRGDAQVLRCEMCHCKFHHACVASRYTPRLKGGFHCKNCSNRDFPFWTVWMPLMEMGMSNGRLVVAPRTHREFNDGYHDSSSIVPSSLSAGPKWMQENITWYSADMQPGDFIIFNIKTLHCANENTTDTYRMSLDTRVTTNQRYVDPRAVRKEREVIIIDDSDDEMEIE